MPDGIRGHMLWSYKTRDQARCVTISSDGQFVAAGSKDGHVYGFNQAGKLLWDRDAGEIGRAHV